MRAVRDLPFTAVITAGGQSSRFGTDKAEARLGDRTLLEHVAASFVGVAGRLLIAPPGRYALPGWPVVPDTRPGEGPLAGLEVALTHAAPGWVAFTGVDLPGLTPGYWRALAAARTPGTWCVQALDEHGRAQPLAALYHTDLRPHVSALLDAGERRLRQAAPLDGTAHVPGLAAALRNVNTPADLAALEER